MSRRCLLLLLFSLSFHTAKAVDHLIELDKDDLTEICSQTKVSPYETYLSKSFQEGDKLDLLHKGNNIYSSGPGYCPIDVTFIIREANIYMIRVSHKDLETNKIFEVYLYGGDGSFTSIDSEEYHKKMAVAEMVKTFDLKKLHEDWFIPVKKRGCTFFYISPEVKVGKVTDGRHTIWKNEKRANVPAIKLTFEGNIPSTCEIYTTNESHETRTRFMRDDFDWHFVDRVRVFIGASTLEPFSEVAARGSPDQTSESTAAGPSGHPARSGTAAAPGATGGVKKTEISSKEDLLALAAAWNVLPEHILLLSTEINYDRFLPRQIDMGDYIICGIPTTVYNKEFGFIDLVSEGTTVIWKRFDGSRFDRATLAKSPFGDLWLLELEYWLKRENALEPVEGLKPKHKRNRYCKEHRYFVKGNGKWQPYDKTTFLGLRKAIIDRYIKYHPEKQFDESFIGFYETCPKKPLEELNISKNLSFKDSYSLAHTAYTKLTKTAIAVIYDINHDPGYVFDIGRYALTSCFKSYTPKTKYVVVKIKDGEQVIWSQLEDGAGCIKIYIYECLNQKLLHLVLDSKKEPNKYYEYRKDYWYEIEPEEHESLLNNYLRLYSGTKVVYDGDKYLIRTSSQPEEG